MRLAVIGGGPAGMMAACQAARNGASVTLFEKNEKLGKKLYITGKGRCNVTNAGGRDVFFGHVLHNPRFLYSAWSALDSAALMALIEEAGTPLKVERGDRVFPVSDKSSDILRAMELLLRQAGVTVRLNTAVMGISVQDGAVVGVETETGTFPCDRVIVATGGVSYPQTGSTGDGYRFAAACGHRIEPACPSLVPLLTKETWPGALSGLTLKNVTLTAFRAGKQVFSQLGELLLTHTGVSGPLVLSLSGVIADHPADTRLAIDLKPGLTAEQLEERLLRDLTENARKQVRAALHALLPERLLHVVLTQAQIDPALPVGELTRSMRRRLTEILKALPLTVTGAGSMEEAVITRGGVSVKEVTPSTLESKLVKGLYFAGEVLDVDAATGGYNLQIAWSTGALSGAKAARQAQEEGTEA